jgi:glycosyltransferase involved in cell wall biosynthesis
MPFTTRKGKRLPPRLSVIIPTLGRDTLPTMLNSIRAQGLHRSDEVLVIADGEQPFARDLVREFGAPFRYLVHGPEHSYGNAQREHGMKRARGQHLVFADDDNAFRPDAFRVIRRAAQETPDRPLIFRVVFLSGHIAPMGPRLVLGDFDAACGVWPNREGRLGYWGQLYGGDFTFARSTLDLYPERDRAAVWRPEIIAVHRPHQQPAEVLKQFAPARVPDAASVELEARDGEQRRPGRADLVGPEFNTGEQQ